MPTIDISTLPKFIRTARERLKMSQDDLAKKAKVTRAFVTLIESGKRMPSVNVLMRLLKVLDVALDVGKRKKMKKSAARSIPT